MKFTPFGEGDTFGTFRGIVDSVKNEIESLDNDFVLKASPTEMEEYYVNKVMIEPLVLYTDDQYIESQSATEVDVSRDFMRVNPYGERISVPGTQLDIAIPYTGADFLWRIQASTWYVRRYPEIDIKDDKIFVSFTFADDSADQEKLRADIEGEIKALADAVQNLSNDVNNHNQSSAGIIKTVVNRKRELALAATDAVAGLGIPMKRTEDPPAFRVPAVRKVIRPKPPEVPTEKYEAEPFLDDAEYDHILEIIRSMSLVIERSPSAFSTLDEEAIRNHFLIQLNGHYKGAATGETFNASGKTDILIREEDKNVFIAECKFWTGQKAFSKAIDQLLGYLSWRDSKCALLVFNKTKDSTAVRAKMHEVMGSRPECIKTITHDPESDCRYIYVKESDPGKEIIITTQLFDIPTE
jgi:hypothetical protein